MGERRISKSKIADYDELVRRIRLDHNGLAFSVEETPTEYIIRYAVGSDISDLLEYVKNPFPGVYVATVTDLRDDVRSIKVKRGSHEGWFFASAPMEELRKVSKIIVGQKVLIAFIDGDRGQGIVIG